MALDVERRAAPLPWSGVRASKVGAYWLVSVGTLALQYAFALVFVDLLAAFRGGRALTALVGGLSVGVMDIGGALSGSLVARFGETRVAFAGAVLSGLGLGLAGRATRLWHLYPTYGIMLGLGHSLALFAGAICVNKWFVARPGLASALGNTGAGLGPLAMPALWRSLKRARSWRGALGVLAVGDFCVLACAATLLGAPTQNAGARIKTDAENGGPEADEKKEETASLRGLPTFRRQCRAIFLFGFGYWIPAIHVVRLALDEGHSRARADALLLYLGAGALTVRVPVGALADALGRPRVFTAGLVSYAALQASVEWLRRSYGGLAVLAGLCGAAIGSLLSLMPTLPAALTDVRGAGPATLARATGYLCAFNGIGGALGPAVAGFLHDATGSYAPGFGFGAAALAAAAAALNWPLPGHDRPAA